MQTLGAAGMKGDEFLTTMAGRPPFAALHPQIAAFLKDYLSGEKVVRFGDQYVINTHLPPYPGPAFDNMAEHFSADAEVRDGKLFSVTLAVTNRCTYRCWHCYNADRSQEDLSLGAWKGIASALQERDVVHVTLSGGEPLLRDDLEQVATSFGPRAYLGLNTTGAGLTGERAAGLRAAGLFALGVSLDSMDGQEHDSLRGRAGAFDTAVRALELAGGAGLYPYVISVARKEFLEPARFRAFMRFAADVGAREIHLLEPCAIGRLAGNEGVVLDETDVQRLLECQAEAASSEDLPIVSSFRYLESPSAFGCGAGITHLYIDGTGEVCPCNLVPLSFGNAVTEPLGAILGRMGSHFDKPRCSCVGQTLRKHVRGSRLPLSRRESEELCERHLAGKHDVPRFFRVRAAATSVGRAELRSAYDHVHAHYDDYWLTEAAAPIHDLLGRIRPGRVSTAFEAGCGTGFATAILAGMLPAGATLTAVDLSEGMLAEARRRLRERGLDSVRFVHGDAMEALRGSPPMDLVISTWALGYIPLEEFFSTAASSMRERGRLGFVVHRDNSPREPLEVLGELIAEDPSSLLKQVRFDFPTDAEAVEERLRSAGFETEYLHRGRIAFRCDSAAAALEHLLKSGAGTAYFDAVDPAKRDELVRRFIALMSARDERRGTHDVIHEYIACIARKT